MMCQLNSNIVLDETPVLSAHKILPSFRKRIFGWRGFVLVSYVQVSLLHFHWARSSRWFHRSDDQVESRQGTQFRRSAGEGQPGKQSDRLSNISFVGISYSDETVSDAAIDFLLEAACRHGVESYILLSERDKNRSLDKKIYLLGQHYYLPLAKDNVVEQPECSKLIHIDQAPDQKRMISLTMSRMKKAGELESFITNHHKKVPNNPLDPDNRIAKIKRAREYQRRLMFDIFTKTQTTPPAFRDSVIAVLDLDMFAYPSVLDVIQTAERNILPSAYGKPDEYKKFHAICANGLQRGDRLSDRQYYDTFSTILLPNTWLFLKETSSRINSEGDDNNKTLAYLPQNEILQWFLEQGANEQGSYDPVPVRSCFGGLTLYRVDVWLLPPCRYDQYNKDNDVYRGGNERHTCEHVVFHECLTHWLTESHRNDGGTEAFSIAVKPDLLTLWHLV